MITLRTTKTKEEVQVMLDRYIKRNSEEYKDWEDYCNKTFASANKDKVRVP